MLTSPRTSAAKSRARCKKEKKEEEEASNRVSHPLQDVEMQDPPYDEGEAHVVIETREVPAIKVERSRAEPSEGIRTPPTKEEAEEGDGTVSGKLVTFAKLAQGLVELSLLPHSICEADLFLQVLYCNAWLFSRL